MGVPSDVKVRNNGKDVGRDQGKVHHCPECDGAPKESCFFNGHLAFCEAANCGKTFATKYGCSRHQYREAYNLRVKAAYEGRDLEEIVARFELALTNLDVAADASMEVKLAELAKGFRHPVEKPKEDEGPKPSNAEIKKAKRTSSLVKKLSKFGR